MFKIREWIDDIRYGSNLVRIGAGAGALLVAVLLYFLIQVVTGGGTTPVGQGGVTRPTGVVVHPQTTPTGNNVPVNTAKPTTTQRPGNVPTTKPNVGITYNTFFKLLSSGQSATKATVAVMALDAKALSNLKDPFKTVAGDIRRDASIALTTDAKAGANKKTLWASNPSLAITNLVDAIKKGAGNSVGSISVNSVGRGGSVKLTDLNKGNILLDRPVTLNYKLGTLSCKVDLEIFLPTFLENGSCN